MAEPVWLLKAVVLALHDEQIAEHGGLSGVRDMNLVDSALDRPKNLHAYGAPDIADLAAAYAYGLARNHGFVDGNKRTSFEACDVFLARNGFELPQTDAENITAWEALGAGTFPEADFAAWLRARITSLS